MLLFTNQAIKKKTNSKTYKAGSRAKGRLQTHEKSK